MITGAGGEVAPPNKIASKKDMGKNQKIIRQVRNYVGLDTYTFLTPTGKAKPRTALPEVCNFST